MTRRELLSGASIAALTFGVTTAMSASVTTTVALPKGGGSSGGGGAVTPTLVQHVGSTVNDNNGITGNGFIFTMPNPVLSGNCLVLGITYPYSSGRTVAISDSAGDTWPAAAITTTDSSNMAQKIFVLPNASANTHTITVTFDTALKPFGYSISEFYNIVSSSPVDGTHGTASVASPNVSAGSYTPTTNNNANGGHLIWTIARSNDKVGTNNANAASAIAPTASQSLLDADNTCTIPGTSAFYVQTTQAAINPGFTITQGTGTNFVCSSVALKAGSAGTAPATGIRIKRILHATYVLGATPVFTFPCDGNLLVAAMSWTGNVTSVTDSNSQTYTAPQADLNTYYHQNATPSNSLTLTINTSINQFSVRFFDIVGAQTSSYDTSSEAAGAAPGSGSSAPNFPDFTPTHAPGLTIAGCAFGTGPGTSVASGSPSGAVFDLVYYTGETDQDRMDNADAVGHVYHSTTAAQAWNWGITSASYGSTATSVAISFK